MGDARHNTRRPGVIHVWVPGIGSGTGGIQAFCRVYVQALHEAHPGMHIRVFVKNDVLTPGDPLCASGIQFHSVCRLPAFLRTMALACLGIGIGLLERPRCVLAAHLHFLPAIRLLRALAGMPMAGVLHGIEVWNLQSRLRIAALKSADHLTAVSQFTRDAAIQAYGFDPERVGVVPNTFDGGAFAPGPRPRHLMERHGLKPGQPVLLTVSRLALSERYKGHRQVMAAMAPIQRRYPEVRYLVVGEGEDLPNLRTEAEALGLKDAVIFAGHVPGSELPDYYRLCDAFVMPSIKEGFGIVFLEAMASGKPVIAGNRDGSVDALDHGRLGVLVDPMDVGAIATAVCQVLDGTHPNRLLFDPAALRAAVVEQFGYPRVSRLIAKDVEPLVTQNGRG